MTHNTTTLNHLAKRVSERKYTTVEYTRISRRAQEIARTVNRIVSRNEKQRRTA